MKMSDHVAGYGCAQRGVKSMLVSGGRGAGERAGLLEELRLLAELDYLSDLRQSANRTRVLAALRSVEAGAYSDREWNGCVAYLLGRQPEAYSGERARELLLQRLRAGGARR